MEAVATRGPIGVSIMVYDDFYLYSGGVYHHVESAKADFDPYYVRTSIILDAHSG